MVQRRRTALWWQATGTISADDVKALVTDFYVDGLTGSGRDGARAVCVNEGTQISPDKECTGYFARKENEKMILENGVVIQIRPLVPGLPVDIPLYDICDVIDAWSFSFVGCSP